MNAARAMARVAWRDARRNRWRSLLVILMIGLPILGLTAAGAVIATATPTADERATGEMGNADLAIFDWEDDLTVDEVLALLPPGQASVYSAWESQTLIGGELRHLSVQDVDPTDPVLGPIFQITSGRAPSAPDEIAVSPRVLERLGVETGGTVTLGEEATLYRIVGTVIKPEELHRDVAIVAPGALASEAEAYRVGLFIDFDATVSQSQVDGAIEASNSHNYQKRINFGFTEDSDVAVLGLSFAVTALVLAETCLIAAAAFVVGARRQMRTIGIIGAAGGEPGHMRALVLSGGILLGLVGSILGVILGVVAALGMTPFLDRIAGRVTGPLSVPPLLPVGAIILGTVAATLAAYAPARAAARLDTVDALAGRTPPPRPAGALARWGLVAAALGLGLIAYATISKSTSMLTVGMFLGIGGFLFAIPFLVTLVGRIATRLPLGARIAARDTSRHGRRTGPAVAAATLALILPVAVATATLSADSKESGNPSMADDQLVITIPQTEQGADAATVQAFLARLEAEVLPGAVAAAAPNAGYSEAIYGVLDVYGSRPGDMPVYAQGPQIDDGHGSIMIFGAVVTIGGPDLLYTLHAEASTQDLNDGYAVVLAERVVDGGIVRIENPFAQGEDDWTFGIPAVEASPGYVASGQVPDLVISPERATELGFELQQPYWVMVRATDPITDENLAAAKELASTFPGISVRGLADTRYSSGPLRLAILAFTGLIALAIIGVAVALVAAESRRDQAILAAVGASPRTRRAIAGNRALLLTLLAAILAVPAGYLPITVIQTASNNGYPIVFPWVAAAVVLILLPLLAGLAAGFSSRQPSETQMLHPIS